MADLIDRQAAHNMMVHLKRYAWTSPVSTEHHVTVDADDVNFGLDKLPAVDAVEVVRCKDCKYGIWDEEEGLWICVFTADYDEELGVYHGFIQYNTADYYCADGERREEDG